jgi:transglutaminase/protease-like cytokinesis protein 3
MKVLRWATTILLLAPGFALLPAALALRGHSLVAVDGVETLSDAVAACQRAGLHGWELVTFAQRLVHRKFTHYSCRNLWDTPAAAFRYGMGYCTQYNLALQQILKRLDVDARVVFSPRVRVVNNPEWNMGHTWLWVTVDDETLNVCAGHAGGT